MHLHELNPFKTVITMLIFVVIIVVGLITHSKPRLTYMLTPKQTVSLAISNEGFVTPDDLKNLLDQSNNKVILIDIRNSYDFARGHISGAENISPVGLISEDNISRLQAFKQTGQSVLLYGNTLDEANGPFMVLRQIGFDNVMVLMHGFEYYQQKIDNLLEIEDMAFVLPEKAAYDYALVIKSPSNFVDKDDASSSQNIGTTRSKTTQNKEH